MFTIGQDELDKAPDLGDTVLCPKCGKHHKVRWGKVVHSDGTQNPSRMLACYNCRGKSYLCGINGKLIMR